MDRQYFEICIGSGSAECDGDFWMCACGVKAPTISEAELFYAADVFRHGGHILGVYPIDRETARSCYNFSYEDRWPVFGLCCNVQEDAV